jgi:chorismate--pyruvate lyase
MEINWLTLPEARLQLSPARYAHLANNGSLTRRVRQVCNGQFEVSLIDHGTVQPSYQECVLLNLSGASQALSRQVFLCCDQTPLIFARTIIGLVEKNRLLTERIAKLGEQSLGSVLFRDPLAVKRQMHLARLPPNHAFFKPLELQGLSLNRDVWLRRSLYDYVGCDLIVYEAFIRFTEVGKAAGKR